MNKEKPHAPTGSETSAVLTANRHPDLRRKQRISFIYLTLMPFLAVIMGFIFGFRHVDWQWYLPAWLLNTTMVAIALRHLLKSRQPGNPLFTATALLLISPWVIFAVFAGMGRPPQSIQGWLELEAEQYTRFNLLIFGGTLAYLGTALLYQLLRKKERLFTTLGMGVITMAIPLFVINMAYWGSFLSESFRHFKTKPRPDWYLAFRELFGLISTVEVSMIYIATALFAMALGKTGYFKPAAMRAYIIVSLLAALIDLIPPTAPDPFSTMSYLVSIPAIPFVMLYLIGVNLLRTGYQPS